MTEYRMGDGATMKVEWTDEIAKPEFIARAGISGNRRVYIIESNGMFHATVNGRTGTGLTTEEALWNTRHGN